MNEQMNESNYAVFTYDDKDLQYESLKILAFGHSFFIYFIDCYYF